MTTQLEGPLDRAALDRAGAGRPVWLKHRSGHRSMVNSVVLERAGLLQGPRQDAHGGGADGVVRSADGPATGLLHEDAPRIIAELRGPLHLEQLVAAITAASRIYAAEGITHLVECGVGGGLLGNGPLEALAYQRAMDDGELQVRVDLMPSLDRLHATGVEAGRGDGPWSADRLRKRTCAARTGQGLAQRVGTVVSLANTPIT